jgi:ADP-ribose pyrophosphatase
MSQSSQEIEIINKERLHNGFMKLDRYQLKHTLYQGGWSGVIERERVKRRDAVAVIPYDPVNDVIILIEQFRVGAIREGESAWLTEIIAGEIEEGEQIEAVARRETVEESGAEIEKLHHCFDFYLSPGGSSEKISLFCGLVDASIAGGIHGLAEEGEDIKVTVVKLSEALEQVNQGQVCSAIPIVGIQWLAMNRDRVRNLWGFESLG